MKTSIIQLENQDDVLSARNKMGWSNSQRILLVLSAQCKNLQRLIDLVLLQREGERLGAQIALVTSDRGVQSNARILGIPVFPNTLAAQQVPWRQVHLLRSAHPAGWKPLSTEVLRTEAGRFHPSTHRLQIQAGPRLALFSLGLLVMLALALLFYPSAVVYITPAQQTQSISLDLWASPEITSLSPSGGIPAQIVRIEVQGQGEIDSTGATSVPDQYAQGQVRLANLTGQALEVPAGTVLRTLDEPPQRFETTQAVSLPAGPNSEVDVSVRALLPGTQGNVAGEQIRAVEGGFGILLAANNQQGLRGGTERLMRAPADGDYARLRAEVLERLRQPALDGLARALEPGRKQLIPGSLKVSKILEETTDPPSGEPGDRLKVSMKVEFSAWTFSQDDLQVVSTASLDASLPKGYHALSGSLELIDLSEPVLDSQGMARWRVQATRLAVANWDSSQAAEKVAGRTREEAASRLSAYLPLQSEPSITLSLPWSNRLPFLAFRIQVKEQ